ncbi:LysR family transcriptional regulator [uncultured Ferrovibrio sp.]|jgi:LysR family glycine cleavage system transcriptional activator|uniref:LysR family transcriptional regulator n=1 Tax=uncultured Ferrovibrio sp. TaxID=1576913 RepID=UPI0026305162|nr:LysR family transcriptional regulator [uncultured Ferrovibrio sp.]
MALPRRFLPPLSALMAFEAAARHGSFTAAAHELNVSQAAISRRVQLLEELLSLTLFERIRQRVVLTPAGAAYARELQEALGRIGRATVNTMAAREGNATLNIATLPTFGTRWLIPRLPDFAAKHPQITINLPTRIETFDFTAEPLDAAISFGDPVWPGAVVDRLIEEELVPVAARKLLARHRIRKPEDLFKIPLLQQATRPTAWADWFAALNIACPPVPLGPRYGQFSMVVQAAVIGLGAAIVPRFLVERELKQGELIAPFSQTIGSKQAYCLFYPEAKRNDPALRAFRDWLVETAKPLAAADPAAKS